MVRQFNWYDPSVLRRVRKRLTIAIYLVIAMILFLQLDAVWYLIKFIFQ